MLTREEKKLIKKMINSKIEIEKELLYKAIQVEKIKIEKLELVIASAIAKQESLTGYELMSQDMNPVIGIRRRCRAGIGSSKRRIKRLEKLVA